jgi:hypothetical protein
VQKNKYCVVSFTDTVPTKVYEVVPQIWVIAQSFVWFPKVSRCSLEKLVEEAEPAPRKLPFRKYAVNVLTDTG